MLQNASFLAIVAVHTADNEPLKVLGAIQSSMQFGPKQPALNSAGLPMAEPLAESKSVNRKILRSLSEASIQPRTG